MYPTTFLALCAWALISSSVDASPIQLPADGTPAPSVTTTFQQDAVVASSALAGSTTHASFPPPLIISVPSSFPPTLASLSSQVLRHAGVGSAVPQSAAAALKPRQQSSGAGDGATSPDGDTTLVPTYFPGEGLNNGSTPIAVDSPASNSTSVPILGLIPRQDPSAVLNNGSSPTPIDSPTANITSIPILGLIPRQDPSGVLNDGSGPNPVGSAAADPPNANKARHNPWRRDGTVSTFLGTYTTSLSETPTYTGPNPSTSSTAGLPQTISPEVAGAIANAIVAADVSPTVSTAPTAVAVVKARQESAAPTPTTSFISSPPSADTTPIPGAAAGAIADGIVSAYFASEIDDHSLSQ